MAKAKKVYTIEHHVNSHWGLRDERNRLEFQRVYVRRTEAGALAWAKKLTNSEGEEASRNWVRTTVGGSANVCYIEAH